MDSIQTQYRRRSSNVTRKILNNDYTISEKDLYPPEDLRCINPSQLDNTYDGESGAYYRYRQEYNRLIEKEGLFD